VQRFLRSWALDGPRREGGGGGEGGGEKKEEEEEREGGGDCSTRHSLDKHHCQFNIKVEKEREV